ncbi:MAG: right-handed parallel beta-helix repeat-containing protein [Phycisphaerales bacterium]|nr:right-handed parallel beta-helix repeat-containing protein [Phycisphaerales bacterium]
MDRHWANRGVTALSFVAAFTVAGVAAAQTPSGIHSMCGVAVPFAAGEPRGGGGNVLVVDCTGADGASTTIQSAIDAAVDGDEVVIMPNTCDPQGRWKERVAIVGKGLTLRSSDPVDPATVDSTILSANVGTTPIIRFDAAGVTGSGGEALQFIVDGLTVRDGNGILVAGGIDTTGGAVTIRRCVLRENHRAARVNQGASLLVEDCRFENNSTDSTSSPSLGAAITSQGNGSALVRNCEFLGHASLVMRFYDPFAPNPVLPYYGRLETCEFRNNQRTLVIAESVDIFDCAFITNTGDCIQCNRLNIDESEFTGNSGSAKTIEVLEQATIARSRFTMNSTTAGAIIRSSNASLDLQDCEFSDQTGAYCVQLIQSQGNISDCVFSNLPGQAVSGSLAGDLTIERCAFLNIEPSFRSALEMLDPSFVVRDSDFVGNVNHTSEGGAARVRGGTFERCRFEGNSSVSSGGAIYATGATTIRNSQFLGNTAMSRGGAIMMSDGAVRNCLIAGNTAHTYSGAIFCTVAGVTGCTIVGNRNFQPNSTSYASQLTNSIVWGNRCIADDTYDNAVLALGVKNSLVDGRITKLVQVTPIVSDTIIDGEPGFVDPGNWDDMGTPDDRSDDVFVLGDYHLLSESPCIDGGNPAFVPTAGEEDFDGEARVQGCRVDMGADEFTDMGYVIGDVNGDGVVTLEDLPEFVAKLLAPRGLGSCAADINEDGRTDGLDAAGMIALLTGI